jgi:predicted lipoprotein with Yx(FWY)xxD motif
MSPWHVLPLLLLLAGCGEPATVEPAADSSTTASEVSPTPRPPGRTTKPEAPPGTRVTVGPSEFGPMLFDARGQAIYLFEKENSPKPACYGACAEAWPPVLTEGKPVAVGEARPGLLGTTKRSDGTAQVTYAGHPLYFYAHEDPGQVLCHDIEEYGGLWLVVTPEGDAAPH